MCYYSLIFQILKELMIYELWEYEQALAAAAE
jgi:hypothetical protein